MTQFDREQVSHLAKLSRLAFTDEESTAFAGQLGAILGYIDKLGALDTANVEPTSHALALQNVLREDHALASLAPAEALANAPAQEAQCFKVPPIIQEM